MGFWFFIYLISFKSWHNFFFPLGKCRDQWYIVRLEVGYFLFLYKITSIILQLTFSLLMIYMSYFVYIHKYTSYTGGTTGKTSLHYWLVWYFSGMLGQIWNHKRKTGVFIFMIIVLVFTIACQKLDIWHREVRQLYGNCHTHIQSWPLVRHGVVNGWQWKG